MDGDGRIGFAPPSAVPRPSTAMARRIVAWLLWVALAGSGPPTSVCAAALTAESPVTYQVVITKAAPVPMRDGINLGAEIYRPDAPGKFPALLMLRYFRAPMQSEQGQFFAQRGYAVALVDCRGRGDSGGDWVPYVNEPRDGFDTQEWLGKQPWCDGKIGTFGISYNGFTQLMPAPLRSRHLKCMIPQECQQTNFGHLYNDGVLQLNVVYQFGLFTQGKLQTQTIPEPTDAHYRRLPLISAVDDYPNVRHVRDWFAHAKYDDYWKAYGVKEKYAKIEAPGYFITGWYDNLVHESFRNFAGLREQGGSENARKGTKIIVGPWAHGGSLGYADFLPLHLKWFDYWLKDAPNGTDKDAPIRIFVMGAEKWRDENEWPLARTKFTKYFLAGDGKANSVKGNGQLVATPPAQAAEKSAPDRFVYDPENPVITLGGQVSTMVPGPQDRRATQERQDVLVYTTAPLETDTEVTGPVELKLYAASSAVDTDFTATLTDVHPGGKAIHVCEGIRGVTFRESLENPTPIEPGKIYKYTISLWETSQVFRAGHRIRVEISSSNFPRYARNQNTGLPLGTSEKVIRATQIVYHDAEHPSHLVLPVIPIEPEGK